MTELVDYLDDFECLLNRSIPSFTRRYSDYDLKKLLTNPIRKNSSIGKFITDKILPETITQEEYNSVLLIVNKFKKNKSSSLCRVRAINNNDVEKIQRYNNYSSKEYRKQVREKRVDSIKLENRNVYLKRKNRTNLMNELKELALFKFGKQYGSHIVNFSDKDLEFHMNGNLIDEEGEITSSIPNFTPFSMFYQVDDDKRGMLDWSKGHYITGDNGESVFVPN